MTPDQIENEVYDSSLRVSRFLRAAAEAAGNCTARLYLNNIKITDDGTTAHIWATDGLVAFFSRCPSIFGKLYTVLLPAAPIRKLKKGEGVVLGEHCAEIGGVRTEYVDATFPDVKRFIPSTTTGESGNQILAYPILKTLDAISKRLSSGYTVQPNGMDPWLVSYDADAFAVAMPQRQGYINSDYYNTLTA